MSRFIDVGRDKSEYSLTSDSPREEPLEKGRGMLKRFSKWMTQVLATTFFSLLEVLGLPSLPEDSKQEKESK